MADLVDVVHYILTVKGEMSAMKLQKLVYYSQAWSLAWDEQALFDSRIEAWAGGPVTPDLYSRHRGMFRVGMSIVPDGNGGRLSPTEKDTIDQVLDFYGDRTAQWLSDLTHLEAPWLKARDRAGAGVGASCSEVITLADMAEYYSGLMNNGTSETVA